MKEINICLVGLGWCLHGMYGPAFKYTSHANLYAGVDIDEERRVEAKAKYPDCKIYPSLEKALNDKNIDAFIIASPVYLHCEQAKKIAPLQKPVLCEKPMARTIKECNEMIEICDKYNTKLMIAYMKRFTLTNKIVKEQIDKGALGNVFLIKIDWSFGFQLSAGWRDSKLNLGGLFQDHGAHTIDLCNWWLNDEIINVAGEIRSVSKKRDIEDVAVAIINYKKGTICVHNMASVIHNYSCERQMEKYEIHGTEGTIEVIWPYFSCVALEQAKIYLYKNPKERIELTPYSYDNLEDRIRERFAYYNELNYFCNCILEDKPMIPSGYDGRKTIEAINAVYLSWAEDKKISLPLKKDIDLESIFTKLKNTPGNDLV